MRAWAILLVLGATPVRAEDAALGPGGPGAGWCGGGDVEAAMSYGDLGRAYRKLYTGVAAVALPHPGVRIERGRDAAPVLAWPLTLALPLAPRRSVVARRTCAGDVRDEFRSHRVVLEPGIAWRSGAEPYVRPGYRFVWHVSRSRWGVGAGIGSTVPLTGDAAGRGSVSPELLLQYGSCCAPGYVALTLRYDRWLSGADRDATVATVGLAY